jgi:hypothetical protein
MSKKPIKSSLFRFVTLRSPQAIEDKETKLGLVLPSVLVRKGDPDALPSPIAPASVYYETIQGAADNATREAALTSLQFSAMETKVALKEAHPVIYDFSSWLMRNKNYLTYHSVASQLPSSIMNSNNPTEIKLATQEEADIWDNLIYQTINRTSTSLREAFIQVLVANKFMVEFQQFHQTVRQSGDLGEGEIVNYIDNQGKFETIDFHKLANASVVIEKEVLLSTLVEEATPTRSMSKSSAEYLQNSLRRSISKSKIREYKKSLVEIEKEERVYNEKNQVIYDAALITHNSSVAAEYEAKKVVDATTGAISYPNLELPEFSYTPLPLNLQDSNGDVFSRTPEEPGTFLSSKTKSLLKTESLYNVASFPELKQRLNDFITVERSNLLKYATPPSKTFRMGGSEITIDPAKQAAHQKYCYSGTLAVTTNFAIEDFTYELYLTIVTGGDDLTISSTSCTFVNNQLSQSYTIESDEHFSSASDNFVSRKFNLSDSLLPVGDYTFSGTIFFTNGDSWTFSATVNYNGQLSPKGTTLFPFRGCGTYVDNQSTPIENPTVNPLNFYGVSSLGIADFRRVEQTICCYVPGEVSHIENILAKEYKEKATRSFVSTEITTEQTRESEVENLTDTTSSERSELSTEVSSVLNEQDSQNYSVSSSVGRNGDKWNFNVSTALGGSSSSSASTSDSEAQNYAQEVTERALERIVQKVSSRRTSRVLREYEENNTHGFDNRKGDKHVTGVYRWVDKVYENQIVNYGMRLMYEFMIPEPSKFLKDALYQAPSNGTNELGLIEPELPIHPSQLELEVETEETTTTTTVKNAGDINKDNYQLLAAHYNAEVSVMPSESISISKGQSLTGDPVDRYWHSNDSFEIDIPENYEATSAVLDLHVVSADTAESQQHGVVLVGGKELRLGPIRNKSDRKYIVFDIKDQNNKTIPYPISGTLSVAVAGDDSFSVSGSVTAICQLTDEAKEQWKNKTYNIIMNAYYDRVNEYNDFMRANQDISQEGEGTRIRFNPAFNRSMEIKELKRAAIELLTKPANITIARDNFGVDTENHPDININDDFQKHAAVAKFFEQAFEWDIMSYQFYPYYYAAKDDWSQLVKQKEDADPLFQAFLQSGMAKMVVPVRPEFRDAMNWYMSTGEVWNGQGMVTDVNDELYLSVVEELTDPVGIAVGEPWKTQVPTSLTIVQDGSAKLTETGLPCNADCGEVSTIEGSSWVISGDTGSNASDGVGADVVGTDNNVA